MPGKYAKLFRRFGPKLGRWLPFLIALSILVTFVYTQPETARELYDQFRTRIMGAKQEPDLVDPVKLFNQLRIDEGLPAFQTNDQLNQTARLLAIAGANDTQLEEFNLKEAASITGYTYESIAYFSLVYSQPAVTPPEQTLLAEENQVEILKRQYTQIGTSTVVLPDSSDTYYLVVIIAQPRTAVTNTATPQQPSYYTGVELWEEIQKYRREHGVPEFRQANILCTLASIRVNQLLELGRLDNHDGFEPLVEEYRDKGLEYGNVAENILKGYATPQEAVTGWDGSLGHRALMRDGSYVWGCAAANHGYAVLIAAF